MMQCAINGSNDQFVELFDYYRPYGPGVKDDNVSGNHAADAKNLPLITTIGSSQMHMSTINMSLFFLGTFHTISDHYRPVAVEQQT